MSNGGDKVVSDGEGVDNPVGGGDGLSDGGEGECTRGVDGVVNTCDGMKDGDDVC